MNIKSESGITLLTLVVTIIVMVILATIVISASVGDNGLVNKTIEATIKTSIREVQEALDVYILLKDKELIKNGDFSGVKPENLTEVINSDYTINISELDVKGEYGKGTDNKDVFKVTYDSINKEYIVSYIDSNGITIEN